jgi:hypothetical protein
MLAAVEKHWPVIQRSLLLATIRKLEQEGPEVPQLREFLLGRVPEIQEATTTPARDSTAVFSRLMDAFVQFQRGLPGQADTASHAKARYLVKKLRNRMTAILLRIHRPDPGEEPHILKHDKTNSVVFHIPKRLTASIDLSDFESGQLLLAYDDGIEEEIDPESTPSIEHPYDPSKTKIETRPITVDLLTRRIQHDEIDLASDFQRRPGLWSKKQKSQLIESLLIRIPLPSFYFDASDDARWLVVDGLQRLVAFKDFMLGKMTLDGLEYLTPYNGKSFEELPRPLRRAIEESQVTIHLIQPGTPSEVKFNIFRRVNTGGIVLTAQEIRHALNQGPVIEFLHSLATSGPFLETTTGSIPISRMADREFVLRFLAFNITPYTEYKTSDMDAFLSRQMGRLNSLEKEYKGYAQKFRNAMETARAIFGKHAFRKLYEKDQPRSPINKALFETWSVHLGNLSERAARYILKRSDDLVQESIELNRDPSFNRAISQGTADVNSVKIRFSRVKAIVDKNAGETPDV